VTRALAKRTAPRGGPPAPRAVPSTPRPSATRVAPKISAAGARSGDCVTIGVADASEVHSLGRPSELYGPGVVTYRPGVTLGALASLADALGLRQLWLTPAALEACGLPADVGRRPYRVRHPFLEAPGRAVPEGQTALAPRLSCWGGGLAPFELLVPQWDAHSPWRALTYAPALLAELVDFTDATAMLWRGSGAVTSDAWLRTYYGKRLEPMDWPPPAEEDLEPDLRTTREPFPTEARARYLAAFDVNGMYLSAASSLALPAGQYVHRPPIEVVWRARPGYWHFAGRWVTTPTAAALAPGFPGAPGEVYDDAYAWLDYHRYLEPWYRTLRDGRERLLETGAGVALQALKAVYREGVGRFGSVNRTRERDPLYLPYWRQAVQAEARTRLERHIAALGQAPVAVEVDCLYFLTNYRNPGLLARGLGLTLGSGLGRFRFVGSARARDAREALALPTLRERLACLRGLVSERGSDAAQ